MTEKDDDGWRAEYARDRWERIVRVAASRPYLRYTATLDNRTSEEHRRWHGTILRWDHPWWHDHYPPNGPGCRCTVIQLSDDDLEEYGYEVSNKPPS